MSLVVTVSSNINIYSNSSVNSRGYELFASKVLQKTFTIVDDTKYTDSFENIEQNSFGENYNNYSNTIDAKLKFTNKSTQNKSEQLTPEEKKEVEKLQKTDQKVRAHEQAHLSAGAGLVRGGASFEYTRGPDGKMYAVGGEVKIDISPIPGKPDETIRKMQKVITAALAPVDPSPQDRAVATMARNIITKAQMEKNQEALKTSENKNQQNSPNSEIINEKNIDRTKNSASNKSYDNNKTENNKKVIKQYIINNPYQSLDRILFKSI